MTGIKAPRSLRSNLADKLAENILDNSAKGVTTAVAGLIVVAGITGTQAQQAPLNPVTVDAPTARPKPPAKLTADQKRARAALRRAQQRRQENAQAVAAQQPPATPPDANPYANPAAPYMATRLASPKFSETIANTPKSITVLTKELIEDKNATTLRQAVLSTAGVTLGAGEGGNAFGDRFFIRGFDARNDVFVDGIRDPGVSVRENFFTEQIEILRGPASSFAGRGTTGGAINIVTKQAGDKDFLKSDASVGTANTKRITVDTNKVVNSDFSVRFGALGQDSGTPGRNYVEDDRWGGFVATKWQPNNDVKVTANYFHTDLDGKPDFGVPWDRRNKTPSPETYGGSDTWYGFVNRDFQKVRQDVATVSEEVKLNSIATLNNRTRVERSTLDYVGTLAEAPSSRAPTLPGYVADPAGYGLTQLNPQSRFQKTNVVANQTDVTFKYDFGPFQHTTVTGAEFSNEQLSFQGYRGLSSEALPGGATGTGGVIIPIGMPNNNLAFTGPAPALGFNPQNVTVDTKAAYLIETANYRDFIILNGGIRYDDYSVNSANGQGQQSVNSGIVSYNGGIVVKPTPFSSVYAAYATSANPVGAEIDGSNASYGGLPAVATTNQVFSPEQNAAAELGTKWELFDRRLLATAALFRTDKSNARELGAVTAGGASTVVAGAEYHVQGIDLGLTGKITDRWSVFGGLVLMDSRVDKSNVVNPTTYYATNVGLKLANVAHQSFNLMTKYKFDNGWELGGQAVYRSEIYGGTLLAANQGTTLPSYWRFDTFVEKQFDKNVTLKLFANNIFDKVYYDALYQSAAPFVLVAPGRSLVGMVSMKF